MRSKEWSRILAGLTLAAPMAYVAHAEIYLSESQAALVLFPGVTLAPRWMDLSPAEAKAITKASGERVLKPRVRMLVGPQKEVLIIDEVVGKHEFITYAVAILPNGKVKGIEILDYRETYGYQVREKGWRDHFVGKNSSDPLIIDQDIPNMSGATLSSVHITKGVRRVLQTYEILKAKV